MRKILGLLLLISTIFGCSEEDEIIDYDHVRINTSSQNYNFTVKYDTHISNSYLVGKTQDQLSIVMMDTMLNYLCEIHLLDLKLLSYQAPFKIGQDFHKGLGEVQIIDLNTFQECIFCENDSLNYVGNTSNGIEIEVTSYIDGVLAGKFSGAIKTATGRETIIEKGQFRVAIEMKPGA